MAVFTQGLPIEFDVTSTNGASVNLLSTSYTVGPNRLVKLRLEVFIVDLVSGDQGVGERMVPIRRGASGNAVSGTIVNIIALQTPGTLSGATISGSLNTNSVQGVFTGVSGRNIRAIGKVFIESAQD